MAAAGNSSLVGCGLIEQIKRGIDLLELMFNLASLVGIFCQLKLLNEFFLSRLQIAYDYGHCAPAIARYSALSIARALGSV
jgi:hypothetical protein